VYVNVPWLYDALPGKPRQWRTSSVCYGRPISVTVICFGRQTWRGSRCDKNVVDVVDLRGWNHRQHNCMQAWRRRQRNLIIYDRLSLVSGVRYPTDTLGLQLRTRNHITFSLRPNYATWLSYRSESDGPPPTLWLRNKKLSCRFVFTYLCIQSHQNYGSITYRILLPQSTAAAAGKVEYHLYAFALRPQSTPLCVIWDEP